MIKDIIHNLLREINDEECFVLQKYLHAKTDYRNIKNKESVGVNDKIIKDDLRKIKNADAYGILKNSLLLTMDDNLSGHFDKRSLAVLRIQRDILFYDLLRFRGINVYGSNMINKQLQFLEATESYDLLLDMLYRKKKYISLYEGHKEYKKISEKISFFELCRSHLNSTIDVFLQCGELNLPDAAILHPQEYYHKQLQKITAYYKQTQSKQIGYYLQNIKLIYSSHLSHPGVVVKSTGEVLDFLDANPQIFSSSMRFFALLNLAFAHIKNLDFSAALLVLEKTWSLDSNAINVHTRLQLFQTIKFYSGVEPDARDSFAYQEKIKLPDSIIFKSFLLEASMLFIHKEFTTLAQKLNAYPLIEEDREGWHFYFKLLHIMVVIELEKFDEAVFEIERFRKQIERGKKMVINYQRWQTIKKILVNLSTNSFDFKRASQRKTENLTNLKSMQSPFRWIPGEAELIPFHAWYEAKINQLHYDQAKAMAEFRVILEESKSHYKFEENNEPANQFFCEAKT